MTCEEDGKHDYVIWRGRYVCAECGIEKNYAKED